MLLPNNVRYHRILHLHDYQCFSENILIIKYMEKKFSFGGGTTKLWEKVIILKQDWVIFVTKKHGIYTITYIGHANLLGALLAKNKIKKTLMVGLTPWKLKGVNTGTIQDLFLFILHMFIKTGVNTEIIENLISRGFGFF